MKIVITCNMGASTSMLQMKLQEEAKKRNIDVEIDALPYMNLKDVYSSIDILLCSPQVRFAYDELKSHMDGKPCIQLSIQDFGMMNAPKIMDDLAPYLTK